jgi:hypothetical protein
VRQVGGQQQRVFGHGGRGRRQGERALAQLLVLGGVQRGADALGGVDLRLRGLALELLQAVQPLGQLLHAGACERGLGDVLLGGAGLLQPGLQLVAHLEGQGRQGAALHLVQGQGRGLALERPGQVRQVRGVHQRILRQRRLRGLGRLGGVARLARSGGLVRGGLRRRAGAACQRERQARTGQCNGQAAKRE